MHRSVAVAGQDQARVDPLRVADGHHAAGIGCGGHPLVDDRGERVCFVSRIIVQPLGRITFLFDANESNISKASPGLMVTGTLIRALVPVDVTFEAPTKATFSIGRAISIVWLVVALAPAVTSTVNVAL